MFAARGFLSIVLISSTMEYKHKPSGPNYKHGSSSTRHKHEVVGGHVS